MAFTAYVDSTISMQEKTVFDKVLVNKGTLETNPYDVTTGVFTCPVSGHYLISVVVGKFNLKKVQICNDQEKAHSGRNSHSKNRGG